MKKIISLLLLLLLAFSALSLTSCHGRHALDPFTLPEQFDTEKPIEITFWAKNDTNISQVNVYKKAIEDFSAIYPNITVNMKLYTDYGKIYNDVITNIATDTTPNVCITYPDHIATYMLGENIVVPLGDIMNDEKYGLGGSEVKFDAVTRDEIVPSFLNECIVNEDYYALPFMRSTEACYINKDFVNSLGYDTIPEVITWDFIFEVSEKAVSLGKKTVKNEKGEDVEVFVANEQEVLLPFIYKSTDNMMIQMLKQKGADYSNENGDILIFNEETEDILFSIAEKVDKKAFSTFKISGYPANFLNSGQCIFAIDSTAGATWMGSEAPLIDIPEERLLSFETVVRPVPQFDTENPQMISQGPSMCIFNKADNQEVLASWLFMQFLLTDGVQISYSQTEGYVPVTTRAQSSDVYRDYLSRSGEDNDLYYNVKLEATNLLLDNIDNTFVTPVFSNSASLRNAAGQMIEEVTKNRRRNKTVDEKFMDNLYREMNSLYKLNIVRTGYQDDLGKLPSGAVTLIIILCAVWCATITYFVWLYLKKRKQCKTNP